METLGKVLRTARQKKKLILRKVAAAVDIDQSLISKFEKDERKPTREQITRLAEFYEIPESELTVNWYSDKIAEELRYSEASSEILRVAEEKIEYYKAQGNGK
jgi:transcriptional regulator with XRE-family HTH domain